MKKIAEDQRPIGKGTGYKIFYSEDVIKETEKAFLVRMYSDAYGDFFNRWLPKANMLSYEHIDKRDLIYNGIDYVKNHNYGKIRSQYFIPTFFVNDKSSLPTCAEISESHKNLNNIISDNDIIGVKGIDY